MTNFSVSESGGSCFLNGIRLSVAEIENLFEVLGLFLVKKDRYQVIDDLRSKAFDASLKKACGKKLISLKETNELYKGFFTKLKRDESNED